YPLYQVGNPQQRVFLPNFWLKLVRPSHKFPPNVVQFIVSIQMTKYDIRNYLEKIYKIPVVNVRTVVTMGKTEQDQLKGYVTKEDDFKVAFVTLPRGQEFHFPDIFPKDEKKLDDDAKTLEETKKNYREFLDKSNQQPGIPGWYSF
ncbi:putative 39S ribosomal protein L23, mitochondrial, partial [Zootermopsis nevadensis]